MTSPPTKRTLILGGGPTALAAGVRLARAGVPVTLLERLPWVGGLSKTFEHGPYHLDLGPHRFTPHTPEVYGFVKDLCGDELQVVRYRAEILVRGRFIHYPFSIKDFLTRIPPAASARLVIPYLLATLRTKTENEATYESWVRHRFGNGVTEDVLRPLVEKVWGTPLSQLAPRFARQRIAIASLREIVVEMLTGRRHPRFRSPYYPDNCFLYPRGGFGRIVDRMAEEFVKAGGKIVTGATVNSIIRTGDRIVSVGYEKEGRKEQEEAGFVISTLPIQYFFQIVQPRPPEATLNATHQLKWRRLILLYAVLKKDRFSENTSLYYPSPEFPYGRMWEQKNHSADTIPVKDRTVLGMEIPCWEGDATWKADDRTLLEKAIRPLERLGRLSMSDVEESFTVRLGYVYPVWDLQWETHMNVLLDYERPIENLIFNGRPGLFFYNNLHHSLDMGFRSADHVLSGKPKAEKWDLDAKAFEQYHLVE